VDVVRFYSRDSYMDWSRRFVSWLFCILILKFHLIYLWFYVYYTYRYNFSNNWQLWLNTATALQQTLSSCLLTLARKRHTDFVERCVCEIFKKDCEVEYRARRLVGYDVPNTSVKIEWSAEHLFERVLDWYAAFVGSGYSASGSLLLVAVWVSTGSLMNWGDNWWLIIGTWSGVVGTFNAAVLRYSLFRQEEKAGKEYNALIEQDKVIFNALGLKCACDQRKSVENELGCMARLSLFTSWACATPWTVMGTLALIIGLLIGATVVLWCEAAQLLVNSVTMVVESFFLIVLIEAHIIQAAKHRVHLHDLLVRRLQLLVILKRIEMDREDACLLDSSVKNVSENESDSLKLLEEEEESV
jgi:low-affinity ferrous iron transport protein